MKKGFTLLELLIVIIILGIIVAIAIPRYFASVEKARETEAKATLAAIRSAELGYSSTGAGVWDTTFPIEVNLSGGEQYDISLAQPTSSSFVYTISGSCGIATTSTSGTSYYGCFESGKIGTGTTCACP